MDDILMKVSEYFGILPDNRLYHNHPKIYKRVSIIHAMYNSAITMYPITYSIIYMEDKYGDQTNAQMACDIMSLVKTIFYALIASFSLLYRNVFYPSDYITMKSSFMEIDEFIERRGIKISKHHDWLRCVVFVIALTFYMIYSFHVFGHEAHIIYIVLINWVHFNFLLEIVIAWRWLELVRVRFVIFNKLLHDILLQATNPEKNYEFVVASVSPDPTEITKRAVIDLINIHKRLVRIIHIFNVFMGISVACRSLLFVIGSLSVVLRISAGIWDEFILSIVDTIIDGFGWFVFIYKAQHVIDQGQNAINRCLDVTSAWLELNNKTEEDKELMAHLTQRVSTQMPQFSAARFYSIDFAAFFMIVNMTTGYIVIVVQFSQN